MVSVRSFGMITTDAITILLSLNLLSGLLDAQQVTASANRKSGGPARIST
jgi:hypothetical protein